MKKMNKTKKITALLLALTMGASLVACGSSSSPEATSSETTAVDDNSVSQVQIDAPAADDSFDLSSAGFVYAGEFSEGYAWVREKDSKFFYLVDKTGKKCCQIELKSVPSMSYTNAPSLVHEGATFVPAAMSNGKVTSMIIDTQGNTLYTLPSEENNYERCLADGDGYFLLQRHFSSFDENTTGYVVVNKNGEDQTPLITDIQTEGDCRYLSDGIFAIGNYFIDVNNTAGVVPAPKESNISFSMDKRKSRKNDQLSSQKGKIWVSMENYDEPNESSRGIGLIDAHTYDYTFISATDSRAYGTYAVADNVYYDIDGNKIDLSLYGDKANDYSPVSDKGLIAVHLSGADGNGYLAYVDTQGNEKIAPFKAGSYYDENHYCTIENNTLTVYDPDGTQVMQTAIGGVVDKNQLDLYKDYVICLGCYYFF